MSQQPSSPASPQSVSADPSKRVNYVQGMVLGVDDFTQQFSYHDARSRWPVRDLAGYGTVVGLPVLSKGNNNDLQIEVGPGTAVVPSGRRVVVSATQCARLNDWLRRELPALQTLLTAQNPTPGATPAVDPLKGTVTVAVVLSHVDCPTDRVPLPGEPCRTEEEALAPSRIQDHFRLALRLQRPDQREEEALRALVKWVADIPISDTTPSSSEAQLCAALRTAVQAWSPDKALPASLAAPPPGLSISTADAPARLRSLFRVWTIELRPRWQPEGLEAWCGCAGHAASAAGVALDEVLLAELVLDLSLGGTPTTVVCQQVTVDESRRPFLLHTRFLQEWLLAKSQVAQTTPGAVSLAGDVTGVASQTQVVALQGQPVAADKPIPSQVLWYEGGSWRPKGLPEANGEVQGPLENLMVKQLGGIEVGSAMSATPGAVLTLDSSSGVNRWLPQLPVPAPVPTLPNLQGDVTGNLTNNQVAQFQQLPVAGPPAFPIQDDQILLVKGGQWTRGNLPPADGDVTGPWNGLKVSKLGGVPLQIPPSVPPNRFMGLTRDSTGALQWEAKTVDLTGDVTGESDSTVVTRLQKFDVIRPIPNMAGVLAFDGESFEVRPETATPGIVRAPRAQRYEIVAAGNLLSTAPGKVLGSLKMQTLAGNPNIFELQFDGYDKQLMDQYIVKVLPICNLDIKTLIVVNLVRPYSDTGLLLRLQSIPAVGGPSLNGLIGLSIEVSRFEV